MDELTKTIQGRPLHMLTITDPRNLIPKRRRREMMEEVAAEAQREAEEPLLEEGEEEEGASAVSSPRCQSSNLVILSC